MCGAAVWGGERGVKCRVEGITVHIVQRSASEGTHPSPCTVFGIVNRCKALLRYRPSCDTDLQSYM